MPVLHFPHLKYLTALRRFKRGMQCLDHAMDHLTNNYAKIETPDTMKRRQEAIVILFHCQEALASELPKRRRRS